MPDRQVHQAKTQSGGGRHLAEQGGKSFFKKYRAGIRRLPPARPSREVKDEDDGDPHQVVGDRPPSAPRRIPQPLLASKPDDQRVVTEVERQADEHEREEEVLVVRQTGPDDDNCRENRPEAELRVPSRGVVLHAARIQRLERPPE
ncbi:MAG TPA: hypothetical protein VG964_00460 [Candidatus Saccharimonadales bacterium]|nr:hypothetical protein [Candidatus Saccharimonadales bacterium]